MEGASTSNVASEVGSQNTIAIGTGNDALTGKHGDFLGIFGVEGIILVCEIAVDMVLLLLEGYK